MPDTKLMPEVHFKSITVTGLAPGPGVIILGAVHGNETCGTRAIQRGLGKKTRPRSR